MTRRKKNKTPKETIPVVAEPVSLYISGGSLISDLIDKTRQGISKNFLDALSKKFSFTLSELANIFHVSERTLQRYGAKEKLSTDISEKALLLEELYKKGADVFGSVEIFNLWMRTPHLLFDKKAPITYLDTTLGFEYIHSELIKIEHGICV